MKKYLKNLKKIAKYTRSKEDNEKINNVVLMKNSIYQSTKENLNNEDFIKLSNGGTEKFENFLSINDQQSELEIEAINNYVSFLSLFDDNDDGNSNGNGQSNENDNNNDNVVSANNDGLAVEMDDNGNFGSSIDVKSIDVKASSYGEALELITDKLLNRIDYADDKEKDSIARSLGKIYRSLSLRSISDPDPDTTATLNHLYSAVYDKLTNSNPEYKEELEKPMNNEKSSYLSKREKAYTQKLNLVKDKPLSSIENPQKINEVFQTNDGNTYNRYKKLMANSLKYKLIEGIKNNSPEIKNLVLSKLNKLAEIYNEYKQELAYTKDSNLNGFEGKLLEMADILDIYNDVYSVALTNGVIEYTEKSKILLPLEPNEKMIKCLNVLKYKRLVRLMKSLKIFDKNLLPHNGMENKFNEPSYENLSNHENSLSLSDIFKNIENLDLPSSRPLSNLVIFLSIFKVLDNYLKGIEEKYITDNAARLVQVNSNDVNESIKKSLKINSPLDMNPEDLYFSQMLSTISDDDGVSNFSNEDTYNEIMADSISSVLSDLKSFSNDEKLLPMDNEIKVNEDSGEILQDTLVEGENSISSAMNYVNEMVKDIMESDNPQAKALVNKINKILKKAIKKAKKQLIRSVGHNSVSDIIKACEYISSLDKVASSISSNQGNKEFSSSAFVSKIEEISNSYNTDITNNKYKKLRNRKIVKQLRKTLKKLLFKKH
ncbi:hypothetical protein BCR36DRAFT_311815 [Piromyces finnis]|uniref:Uncharacterized protein n=1 Tax=Piromyces finnis TaxID=1754191 RepID=A0A1Y1UJ86_9FUNG|nr:hypothetical protein BCR36DRAFT_313508 [Piromyces finnis]ORX41355.1 hypothetical protein BCR36DRAFT_311815 [Piromyces finnis]|eukprot:ORX38128.1 hypothetical protein BCR36DRAFT_313508 [Piromyces finnis]